MQAQIGVSYEAGVRFNDKRQKLEFDIYRLNLTNEIAFDPTQTAEQPFGAYRNLDNTQRNGVTLSDDYTLTKSLSLNGQINAVDARFVAGPYSGNQIPAVPAFTANAGAGYWFSKHWKINYNALYNGSQYASNDDTNSGGEIPGYWLHNVALQYFYKALTLSFMINNLLNQRYSTFSSYDVTTQTESFYPGDGRNYLLVMKINVG